MTEDYVQALKGQIEIWDHWQTEAGAAAVAEMRREYAGSVNDQLFDLSAPDFALLVERCSPMFITQEVCRELRRSAKDVYSVPLESKHISLSGPVLFWFAEPLPLPRVPDYSPNIQAIVCERVTGLNTSTGVEAVEGVRLISYGRISRTTRPHVHAMLFWPFGDPAGGWKAVRASDASNMMRDMGALERCYFLALQNFIIEQRGPVIAHVLNERESRSVAPWIAEGKPVVFTLSVKGESPSRAVEPQAQSGGRYSIALEQQINLLGWLETDLASIWFLDLLRSLRPEDEMSAGTEAIARLLQGDARHAVETGEAYFCGESISTALATAAASMPSWHFAPDMLPSQAGFCWLEKALELPQGDKLCALAWEFKIRESGEQYLFFIPLIENDSWRRSGVPYWGFIPRDEAPDDQDWSFPVWQFFGSLVTFVNQRVMTAQRTLPDRQAAHKARKAFFTTVAPEIRVIQLRRPERAAYAGTDERREYSCQWIVSGHWRKQWYPKSQVHQPRWIAPYLKGDPDKPLKAETAARVYAVVR